MVLSVYSENFAMIYWYSFSVTGTIMQLMNNAFPRKLHVLLMEWLNTVVGGTCMLACITCMYGQIEQRQLFSFWWIITWKKWGFCSDLPLVSYQYFVLSLQSMHSAFAYKFILKPFSMSKFLGASIPTYEHIWLALEHD